MRITFLLFLSFLLNMFQTFSQTTARHVMFEADTLNHPKDHEAFEEIFESKFVVKYVADTIRNQVTLTNGYAEYKIKNREAWNNADKKKQAYEIDVVFTHFPVKKDFWLTNYYELLANRLKELFNIDPELNDDRIEWKMILQTACDDELSASQMFHGIIIKYKEGPFLPPKNTPKNTTITQVKLPDSLLARLQPQKVPIDSGTLMLMEQKVKLFMKKTGGTGDNTVFTIFERNKDWKNILVVMDWTGSMYPYGSQAILWHLMNYYQGQNQILNFVFFNDGGHKADKQKVIGKTGGIYLGVADNFEYLLKMMEKVMHDGDGGDLQENDIEAILRGSQKVKNFGDLVLIADNTSGMRDYKLIKDLKNPVHIILCGKLCALNPQYVNIAYRTGGSLHTLKNDYYDLKAMVKNGKLILDDYQYELTKDDWLKPIVPRTRTFCEPLNWPWKPR